MAVLTHLPKLESLHLLDIESITGIVFEYFTTLKVLRCTGIDQIEEGIYNLIRNCKNIEEICVNNKLSVDEITHTIKRLVEILNGQCHSVSLLVRLNAFRVRMVPIKSEDPANKLLFEIYAFSRDNEVSEHEPCLTTSDKDVFVEQIQSLAETYRRFTIEEYFEEMDDFQVIELIDSD